MATSNSRQTYSQEPKNRAVFRGTGSHFSNNDRRGPYGYQAGALASFTQLPNNRMPVYHTGAAKARDEYESVLLNKYLGRPQLPSTSGYNNLRLMARMSDNRGPYLNNSSSKTGKPPNHPVKAKAKP